MAGNDLTSLADRIAADGFEAHGDVLVRLVNEARAGGVTPLLLGIVLDPTEATVARCRALGRILVELGREPEVSRSLVAVA